MPRSDKGCRKPLNEQAHTSSRANLSIQGMWETPVRSEARPHKHHSYSRQVGFKWVSEITQQMLGLSLTHSVNTADNQHSKQPESKLTKHNCWKAECWWNAWEQEAEFSLGNTIEGHSPTSLVSPNHPLPTLCWTQLQKPPASSCERQAEPAQPVLSHQRDREMLLSRAAANPQQPLGKERRKKHCPSSSNWFNLTLNCALKRMVLISI